MLNDLVRTPARLILPVLMLGVTPALAQAQDPPPPPVQTTQPREHVVRTGDTLWDLARVYLSNPFLWPLIFEANRAIVENPHRIFPAERLTIPGLTQPVPAGTPVPTTPAEPPAIVPEEMPPVDTMAVDTTGAVIATLDLRRPVVPMAEYLATPWLSATVDSELAGRIIRLADPTSEGDRIPSTLQPHAVVHVGALAGARQRGDSLLIVRLGRRIEGYGRLVEPLGLLVVDTIEPTVVTARLVRLFGDAKIGDAVLPLTALPEIGLGEPEPVEGGPQGTLMQFLADEPLHGTGDLAFISLGRGDGIGIGDEFSVYIPARSIDNERVERVPETVVGTVRVVTVADRTSTVRVVSINSAALRSGLAVRLIRRMP